MQNENEELESLEESHALPVHGSVASFILIQKFLTHGDQSVEASPAGSLIQWFKVDLDIVEFDGSHTCPQECAQEQTKIFSRFCFTAGIKINKSNFSVVHQHLRWAECAMRWNQRIWARASLQVAQSFDEGFCS